MKAQNGTGFTGYEAIMEQFEKDMSVIEHSFGLKAATNDQNSSSNPVTDGLSHVVNTTMKAIGTVGSGIIGMINATHNGTEYSIERQLNTNGTNIFNGTDYSPESNNNEENNNNNWYWPYVMIGGIGIGSIVVVTYGGYKIYRCFIPNRSQETIKQNPTNNGSVICMPNLMYGTTESLVIYRPLDRNGFPIPSIPGRIVKNEIARQGNLPAIPPNQEELQYESLPNESKEPQYASVIYTDGQAIIQSSNENAIPSAASRPENGRAMYVNEAPWYDNPKNTKQLNACDTNDTDQVDKKVSYANMGQSWYDNPKNTNQVKDMLSDKDSSYSTDHEQQSNRLVQDLASLGATDHLSQGSTTDLSEDSAGYLVPSPVSKPF